MSDLDTFLAECDDVIADWEGSHDSATWTADGSHERETMGDYYRFDYVVEWEPLRGITAAEIYAEYVETLRRMMSQPLDWEILTGRPRVSPETREIVLRSDAFDAMRPPRYLFRPSLARPLDTA